MATARVILRSCNTRRNIHRVLSGQVRCLHPTTEKPVFRWEVSPPAVSLPQLFVIPKADHPHFQDPLDIESQLSAEEIAIRYAYILAAMFVTRPHLKELSDTARDFCRARTFSHPQLGT